MTSADELVIRAFVSLDLEAMKSKSCLFGGMCRYDDSGGEERRGGTRGGGITAIPRASNIYFDSLVRHVIDCSFPPTSRKRQSSTHELTYNPPIKLMPS